MIKLIAFDLIGVLLRENDFELTPEQAKLERMYGPNITDKDYLIEAKKIIPNNTQIMRTTEYILNNIYDVREENLFKKLKEKYKDIRIIIATNHVSYIRNLIAEVFDKKYLDDIIISAEINKIKPNADFYEYILNKFDLLPQEILFLDDNQDNIDGAMNLGINTIKVNKDTNIFKTIIDFIDKI